MGVDSRESGCDCSSAAGRSSGEVSVDESGDDSSDSSGGEAVRLPYDEPDKLCEW